MLQFAPTYHEYVLYSNEEEDEPTKYSPSTIVPTGEHIVELAEVTVRLQSSSNVRLTAG